MKQRKCTVALVISIVELAVLLGTYLMVFAVPFVISSEWFRKLKAGNAQETPAVEDEFYTDAWENVEYFDEEPQETPQAHPEGYVATCFGCYMELTESDLLADPGWCPYCGLNIATGEPPTPIPTETPKPPVTMTLVSESEARAAINSMGYAKLTVEDTWESSIVEQKGTHNNSASALVDGNVETSWQEGVDGDGLGESVALTLRDGSKVQYIEMHVGNWRTDDWFYKNNVPKSIEIAAYDGMELYESGVVEFGEHRRVTYWVELSEPVEAKYLEFYILDVYKGSKYDDTCIAEITVYGSR